MKTRITISVIFFSLSIGTANDSFAQGCVGVRYMSCSTMSGLLDTAGSHRDTWQASLGYRYLYSYKHFVGKVEQTQRVEEGTQVINTVHSFDIGITHAFTNRFFASLNVPIAFYDRSSLYEHYGNTPGNPRFHSHANGIGDIRVTGNYWLRNPDKYPKRNFSAGLGIKMPSGNPEVMDDFHKKTKSGADSLVRKVVDQSIQLGDGGWGFTVEVQGIWAINHFAGLYANGFYLFNPRGQNNVLRSGYIKDGKLYSSNGVLMDQASAMTAYFSVPDQYAARVGLNFYLLKNNLALSLGVRTEGIPSEDLIGESTGFRRPGYIHSVEPGASYRCKRLTFVVSVPYAVVRDRTKSVADVYQTELLKVDKHGDAAFSDYVVNANVIYRFH